MKKLKWADAEELATCTLWGWRVKHPELTRRLAEVILREGKVPNIRVYWNSKAQDLDFEVLK